MYPPYFHIVARRDFSCSSLSITLCNRVSIRVYNAHWHMNFSLIDGCGTREYNIHGHYFLLMNSPLLQVLAIEFVPFANEFVTLAIEFIHLAIEFVPWAIEFVMTE